MTARGPAAALLLAAAVAGCASVPPAGEPPAPSVDERRSALGTFDDWHAAGRVAVRTAGDGWSASFDWRESGGRSELGVRGPFGAGAARITRTAATVTVESGDGPPLEVPAPFTALDGVLVERLGFRLPIEQLRWWLVGVPAPGPAVLPAQASGGFEQDGWTVRPEQLRSVDGAPAPLPSRVVLERAGTRIRVAIDRWGAAPP